MNARSVAVTALAVALFAGCATTAEEEAPAGNFAFSLLMGVTQIAMEAAVDAAFSTAEKHEKRQHHERSDSWAHAPAAQKTPVSLKRPEGTQP